MNLLFESTYSQGILSAKEVLQYAKEHNCESCMLIDDNFSGFLEFYEACKKADIKPILAQKKVVEGISLAIVLMNVRAYYWLIEKQSTGLSLKDLNKQENISLVVLSVDGIQSRDEIKLKLDCIPNAGIAYGETKNISSKISQILLRDLTREDGRKKYSNFIPKIKLNSDYRTLAVMKTIKANVNTTTATKTTYLKMSQVSQVDYHALDDIHDKTNLISELGNLAVDDYEFGNPTPPKFVFTKEVSAKYGLKEGTTDAELFKHVSEVGLENRFKTKNSHGELVIKENLRTKYRKRLEFEINIINSMGFPGYMLIVADFVQEARDLNIPVGPGRGSAAGSLVAFALNITNIDPIPYDLLFERFLNPERVSMPDIDMDFADKDRVLDYVRDKYGKDRVSQIITFTQLGGRSALQDAARVLGMHDKVAEHFAKVISDKPGTTLQSAYEDNNEAVVEAINSSLLHKKIWNFAQKLDGKIKNQGIHAAGVIIADKPIYKLSPIKVVGKTDKKDGKVAIEYKGKYTEDVDLIKFDFLGLKTLTNIDEAIKNIKIRHGIDIDIDTINFNDKNVLNMLSDGNSFGVFQLESEGMQNLCSRLKPDDFEDVIAILALYRPGPMESGMLDDFVARKNGEKEVKYFFDDYEEKLKPILEPTYGVIVYQEQVMQIVQVIGGFSLGEADIIRRAMGKKDVHYMNIKKEEFADGAEKQGLNRDNAVELFDLIIKFAGYGFNKSHSAAYAMVSIQSAFLKHYYPSEFFASLLNHAPDITRLGLLLDDATKNNGITIDIPEINSLTKDFEVISDNHLSFGMLKMKGVSEVATKKFLKYRNSLPNKRFDSYTQYLTEATDKKSKQIGAGVKKTLVLSCALDELYKSEFPTEDRTNKTQMLIDTKALTPTQELKFLSEPLGSVDEYMLEYQITGRYMNDPIDTGKGRAIFAQFEPFPTFSGEEDSYGSYYLAYMSEFTERLTKKNDPFCFVSLMYKGKIIQASAFNEAYKSLKDLGDYKNPLIFKLTCSKDWGYEVKTVEKIMRKTMQNRFTLKA